jgi:hypothetical protein
MTITPLNLTRLYGTKLAALDGDIGHITDFYFDDKTWVVRYVVAETGSWLTGRKVLLSPFAFDTSHPEGTPIPAVVPVKLTREQIEHSPILESHLPVSRQYEISYYHYYGWPKYWEGKWTWGVGSYPVLLPKEDAEPAGPERQHDQEDNHLRSCRAVAGYSVETHDGDVGHLAGFAGDFRNWTLSGAIVKTGLWHLGKEVLIATRDIDGISYQEHKIYVNVTREDIQQTALDEPVRAGSGDQEAKDFVD